MIVLCTLNARYSHAALGLRYLKANLGAWQAHTEIVEFTIKSDVAQMVNTLLAHQPKIIGLGVYIWNVPETLALIHALRAAAPELIIILGGPEVSYESEAQAIVRAADYVVTGWGEVTLPRLITQLIEGPKPLMKIHAGEQAPLDELQSPYALYTDTDIRQRNLYVEASRGCPFKCEFCLSSLDKTAWGFAIEPFLHEMEALYQRGARTFKFVDRTFNLKPETGRRILAFYLDKIQAAPHDPIFVHFEVIPDHLPEALKELIAQFPVGALQFEVGIQTLNVDVQKNISRTTNLSKARENIRWLLEHSHAHLHVDLIAGLPGETMASFARGFDELITWGAHEIQLGLLKRLRGTPITRHTDEFAMHYASEPPYEILSNRDVSAEDIAAFKLFAKYWDLIANSGRMAQSLPLILADAPYARFASLSAHLGGVWQRSHSIPLEALFAEVATWLQAHSDVGEATIQAHLTRDYCATGAQGKLPWMDKGMTVLTKAGGAQGKTTAHSRQTQHQAASHAPQATH